jgi:uncharacterized protein (UPF0212 family)
MANDVCTYMGHSVGDEFCPYCGYNTGYLIETLIDVHYDDDTDMFVNIADGKLHVEVDNPDIDFPTIDEWQKINYCPMCGRRLNND